jgi:hypothetical protein
MIGGTTLKSYASPNGAAGADKSAAAICQNVLVGYS